MYNNDNHPVWNEISTFECIDERLRYLCISAVSAAECEDELVKHGITHVYRLMNWDATKETKAMYAKLGIRLHWIDVQDEDTEPLVALARKCYWRMDKQRRPLPGKRKPRILVHCFAGVSRSATFVLYHLMRSWRWSLVQAKAVLRRARPVVEPNEGFLCQLRAFEEAHRIRQLERELQATQKQTKKTTDTMRVCWWLTTVGFILLMIRRNPPSLLS